MEYRVNVNGIDIVAAYSEENIRDIFEPLLRHLEQLHKRKGARLLVMVAAPPGAGKTTFVSFLEELSKIMLKEMTLQAIGMDGFHRRQEYLLSHTATVDGNEIPMVEIKGAPVTFDLELFKTYIEKLSTDKTVGWPVYDRTLHNPVEDAVWVNSDIVLLEGNYLLLDQEGWKDLSQSADYTISIKAEEGMLRERLIGRKEALGHSRIQAEKFVDFSDMRNVKLCLERSKKADLELAITEAGEYAVISGENGSVCVRLTKEGADC